MSSGVSIASSNCKLCFSTENTVCDDQMKVGMIVESIAEILNKTDGADLRMNYSGTAGDKPCTYLVDNDLENSLEKRVGFQVMSNSLWETQDKLLDLLS